MTITASELTLFGGLAKVLIPQETENGVLKNTATRFPLTMRYCKPELKICTIGRVEDEFTGEYHKEIVEKPLADFDIENLFDFQQEDIAWRSTLWNFAIHRSLEIWKKLPMAKIEKSLGKVSKFASQSLKGKLGASNGKYVRKCENSNWVFLEFKQTTVDKAFKPFSIAAIEYCKKRARQ